MLDLTRLLPGAAATMLLANFGAEVIKIEEPGRGDYARSMPPFLNGEGAAFHLVNRGKKSVALDLKNPAQREAFRRLAGRADVLIEGFRPGVMKRLGLDYDALRVHSERLIYVALTGYGQSGAYARMAGHDINYLALAGVLDIIGAKDGPPTIPGVQIADLAGGAMQAVIGILLAVVARSKNGKGQMVDVGMIEGAKWLLPVPLARYAATGETPKRGDEPLSGHCACYNVYETGDGRWVAVGALEPKFWAEVCRGLNCEQFIPDQFAEGARQAEIVAEVARRFKGRTAQEWFDFFKNRDACVTPVLTVAEAVGARPAELGVMPQLRATPGAVGAPPPRLGEHTREVLLWAGLSEDEVSRMEP